jgi:hypothetical protein
MLKTKTPFRAPTSATPYPPPCSQRSSEARPEGTRCRAGRAPRSYESVGAFVARIECEWCRMVVIGWPAFALVAIAAPRAAARNARRLLRRGYQRSRQNVPRGHSRCEAKPVRPMNPKPTAIRGKYGVFSALQR